MMRQHIVVIFITLFLIVIHTSHSLPFARKNKQQQQNNEDDNNNEEKKEHAAVRGAAKSVLKDTTETEDNDNADDIFETFFDNDDVFSSELKDEIKKLTKSDSMKEFLIQTRRSLHRHPELMYQENFTSETIQVILKELNIPFTTGWAKNIHQDVIAGKGGYGVVGHIGSMNKEGPCIILRADMDALPILEKTEHVEEFKSQSPGKMHACGHDGHVTMLLGAAAILKSVESSIQGTVRLLFQPAEEGGAGGKRMVEEGVVTLSPPAQHAFGLHVWPTLPSGTIASRAGSLMAAAERFTIVLIGKGGHAAMPHLTIDPIVAASSLIMNLQPVISRVLSPLEAGVISITQLSAGHAFNVIPSTVTVAGTIRSLTLDGLLSLRDILVKRIDATVQLYDLLNSTITFSPDYYPPTVNDPTLYNVFSKRVGKLIDGENYIEDTEPTMGGEDFSFFGQAIPSTFFFLGQGTNPELHTDFGLHHPNFALDESVLPIGVELHVNLALRALKKIHNENSSQKDDDETTKIEL